MLSIGGGGDGGKTGVGGSVIVHNGGSITTSRASSAGIVAQSTGGFGGAGGTGAGQFWGHGGDSGSGGDGGQVVVTSTGQFIRTGEGRTSGTDSQGILAVSIGGGGGVGGAAVGLLGFGGAGSLGGNGGVVAVESASQISTNGDGSSAIQAQSIGGGGGSVATTYGVAAIGSSSGGGGNGGTVSVGSNGTISTKGDQSKGIFAQSVGGSGGYGKLVGAVMAIGGSGGGGGRGDNVEVSATAGIQTTGQDSQAIFAQSIGGGGGAGENSTTLSFRRYLTSGGPARPAAMAEMWPSVSLPSMPGMCCRPAETVQPRYLPSRSAAAVGPVVSPLARCRSVRHLKDTPCRVQLATRRRRRGGRQWRRGQR